VPPRTLRGLPVARHHRVAKARIPVCRLVVDPDLVTDDTRELGRDSDRRAVRSVGAFAVASVWVTFSSDRVLFDRGIPYVGRGDGVGAPSSTVGVAASSRLSSEQISGGLSTSMALCIERRWSTSPPTHPPSAVPPATSPMPRTTVSALCLRCPVITPDSFPARFRPAGVLPPVLLIALVVRQVAAGMPRSRTTLSPENTRIAPPASLSERRHAGGDVTGGMTQAQSTAF
jgi:hypothetical protein